MDSPHDRQGAQGGGVRGAAQLDRRPAGDAGRARAQHMREGRPLRGPRPVPRRLQGALQQVQGLPVQLAVPGLRGQALREAGPEPVLLQLVPGPPRRRLPPSIQVLPGEMGPGPGRRQAQRVQARHRLRPRGVRGGDRADIGGAGPRAEPAAHNRREPRGGLATSFWTISGGPSLLS